MAELFDDQMIKCYLIIKPTELLDNIVPPGGEPSLDMYTCKVVQDNEHCFQELMHIVQKIKAKVYVDEFNIHSKFSAA